MTATSAVELDRPVLSDRDLAMLHDAADIARRVGFSLTDPAEHADFLALLDRIDSYLNSIGFTAETPITFV